MDALKKKVDDSVDDLIRNGTMKSARVLFHEFSVGLGQIHPSAALEVEDLAAATEGRSARTTEDEIGKAMVDSDEISIKYLAAILRRAQDVYAAYGMDVSARPEVLVTLSNLGEYEKFAQISQKKGASPRVNNYGLYTERLLPLLEIVLSDRPLPAEEKLILPSDADQDHFE